MASSTFPSAGRAGSQPHKQKQGQQPRRGYETLPDLRFLNHNAPAPTASSILDPNSKNSAGVLQLQALKDAEAWYMGTATMLRERLALCERLRDGLGEVNGLLERIGSSRGEVGAGEALKRDGGDESTVKSNLVEAGGDEEGPAPASIAEEVGDVSDDLKAMEDAVEVWLRDIRVSRAKWIAGGRDTEKRMGLR